MGDRCRVSCLFPPYPDPGKHENALAQAPRHHWTFRFSPSSVNMPGELRRMHLTPVELSRIDALRMGGRTPNDIRTKINHSRSIRNITPISKTAVYDYLGGQAVGRSRCDCHAAAVQQRGGGFRHRTESTANKKTSAVGDALGRCPRETSSGDAPVAGRGPR